jgi:hypothetical protein
MEHRVRIRMTSVGRDFGVDFHPAAKILGHAVSRFDFFAVFRGWRMKVTGAFANPEGSQAGIRGAPPNAWIRGPERCLTL